VSDTTICLLVLTAVVAVFVWDRLPVGMVAIGTALSLWATGVLDYDQVFAGFGDPTVIFIASLFVVSEGLDAAGVTSWAGQELIARVGESRTRLIVLTMLLVATLTALISVNGSVAALVPVVVVMAVRLGCSPSQLLLPLAFGALAGMVILLATGIVPAAVAGLLAACAMVLLSVLAVEQAYRGISWTTVVLVGGMISLSTAMVETGAAETLAYRLVGIVGDAGPYSLLLGIFLLTAALGQLISNMATALIVIPIAISAAAEMDVSAQPVLMVVAVSAAASFLTPVATPANLMVMGPGGYRFGDYWKLGLPLLALFCAVAVLLVPVFWSF
jgi:di/tricarboxylate transporter